MHHATTEGLCSASCRTLLDNLEEQVPDSQDVGHWRRRRVSELTGAVGGAEAHRTVGMRWRSLMHGKCGVGEQSEREQQGWAKEQRGGGENTCDCDSESHSKPVEQSGGTGDVQPRREQSRSREGGGGGA